MILHALIVTCQVLRVQVATAGICYTTVIATKQHNVRMVTSSLSTTHALHVSFHALLANLHLQIAQVV